MVKDKFVEEVEFPEGVTVSKEDEFYVIKGPKGETKRKFRNPRIKISLENKKIQFSTKNNSKKDKTMLKTYVSHMKNALEGVTKGFVYKLKICSGHFPMTVSVSNEMLTIKNFLGEKVPRKVSLKKNVSVKVDGSNVIVESTDKEAAGQTAADIEQTTRRANFDKRIFQDGIYITEKAGKKI